MKTKSKFITAGAALGVMLLGSASFLSGDDGNSDRNNQFDFALIGDVPYAPTAVINQASTVVPPPTAKVQTYPSAEYNALIADINAHSKVLFTVHVGDIKAGDTWCVGGSARDASAPGAANVYTSNFAFFNTFRNALVYIPGDNEWTDCHRTNNGAYNPTERLNYLRTVFFPSNQSLGQRPITLNRQPLYPENVTWRTGGVLFVGINQPGSNNNKQRNIGASVPAPTDDNEAEFNQRNTANIAWLNAAFTTATTDTSVRAIVIMQQANVFERYLEPGQLYTRSGYEAFVKALRDNTVAWGKPVVLVGGDTHTVRIDKPLTTTTVRDSAGNLLGFPGHINAPGTTPVQTVASTTLFSTVNGAICTTLSATCVAPTRVQNFTRVEVFGSPDVAWIRAIVDPFDPNVFSFSPQTIAGTGHGRDGREDDDDLN